ncbi:DNA polymerase III subunit beta [Sulfobacillus harzensis]|uniref:Beta sliding clamp n=1 Tax=Sulfobacillus harzensis TaxID=2729629 RepID=A0A7Y0Q144_9FIRM|nr:DNA polymerase III subunit beta [Sulfobacillus harzensis]NMP20915.1 DNA polymerase III subunit beta [Sulfobacillus harzensis]
MHIYATQDQLAKALATVSRVIMPQNNMPILAGIQLDARDNLLTLTATDLFTTLQSEIAAEVTEPGTIVLPASLLTELVQRIPTATLELGTEDSGAKAVIKYGKNRATLHGFGSERLPEFQALEGSLETVVIGSGIFTRLARELLFACAKDETRPILRGVSLTLDSGRLIFATTDGTRLSHTWVAVPEYRGGERSCVVPAKLVAESARLNAAEDAELTLGSNLVRIRTGSSVIVSRLLDGQYPDYQRVIPQEFVVQGRVRVSDFRGALERANLIAARDRTSSVRIRHQGGQLDISASAQEFGQTYESVEFDSHGQELDLLFNPVYLLEALKSLEGEEAVLEFSGVQSPLRIRDTENAQYSHVVLPLRQLV